MENSWVKELEEGQYAIGFVEVYSTKVNGMPLKAIINYFPQLLDDNNKRNISVTVFIVGNKEKITKSLFYEMMNDIGEIVKNSEPLKFNKESPSIPYMITQSFFVEKLPELKYYTHGDFDISKN